MKSSPIRLTKQKLSSKASAAKAKRDLEFAKSSARKAKKAENQRLRRNNPIAAAGKDYDHKTSSFRSIKANRGNDGKGTRLESGKKYKVN